MPPVKNSTPRMPLFGLPYEQFPPTPPDETWVFDENDRLHSPPSLPTYLKAPEAPRPPPGQFFPEPPLEGYELVEDPRYKRGFVYRARYDTSKQTIHRLRLLHIATPPNVYPKLQDGLYKAEPILGMIQMIPGIPFVFELNGDRTRTHTVGCVHMLDSLSMYPDYQEILRASVALAKLTWGCAAEEDSPAIPPIFSLVGLKINDRSAAREPFHQNAYDGSYSLGSTVMKGEGMGTFLPAVQADSPEASAQISAALQLLHDIHNRVMEKSLSFLELKLTQFYSRYNNIFGFGGSEPNGTSCQLNVSSLGETLVNAIGRVQGFWHPDQGNDPIDWSLFVLLLRLGPTGDPGPFCLARGGIYARELNSWIIFLTFKGTDLHSGFAPSEDRQAHLDWVNTELSAAWNLAGPQNRVGYVNYKGVLPMHRLGSLNVSPHTRFGNYGSSAPHKATQTNFALHGHVSLGDQAAFSNRHGREAVSNFMNSVEFAKLKLDMDVDDLLQRLTYEDSTAGHAVHLKPFPYHPLKDAETIRHNLSHYHWLAQEAHLFNLGITKKALNDAKAKRGLLWEEDPSLSVKRSASSASDSFDPSQIKEIAFDKNHKIYIVYVENSEDTLELEQSDPRIEAWMKDRLPSSIKPGRFIPQAQQSQSRPIPETASDSRTEKEGSALKRKASDNGEQEPKRPCRSSNRRGHSAGEHSNALLASEDGKDQRYEVEEIIAHRQEEASLRMQWRVKWKGYAEDDNLWLYEEDLGECLELLGEYNKRCGITAQALQETEVVDEPSAKKNQPPKASGAVQLAENLDVLTHLLDEEAVERETQSLLFQEQHGSLIPDCIRFELMQRSMQVLKPIGAAIQQLELLTRAFRQEMCRSLVTAFHWYTQIGPQFTKDLLALHERGGFQELSETIPLALATLVDHVVQYVYRDMQKDFHQRRKNPSKTSRQKAPSKTLREKFPEFDGWKDTHFNPQPIQDHEKLPYDLYGVRLQSARTSSSSRAPIQIPRPRYYGTQKSTTPIPALYLASQGCLESLWSTELLVPHLRLIDDEFSTGRRAFSTESIRERSITRGAILACIAEACGSDGIFASNRMNNFIQSPALLFKDCMHQDSKISAAVLKRREEVLAPLFESIEAHLSLHPGLASKAEQLGLSVQRQMLALHNGEPVEDDNDDNVQSKNAQLLMMPENSAKVCQPKNIPGYVVCFDQCIWGQATNLMDITPSMVGQKASSKPGTTKAAIQKLSLEKKFSPYWSDEVQNAWVELLGDMVDQDPLAWQGEKLGWKKTITFIQELRIPLFQNGLTLLQTINNLVFAGIVSMPSLEEVVDWISETKLGAYKGLQYLNFSVRSREAILFGFASVYWHLNHHLTDADKEVLGFNPLFIEHVLCKLPRWNGRLSKAGALQNLEALGKAAEESANNWLPGQNESDCQAFPFPLIIDQDFLTSVLKDITSV
ncbi:hypothetical protein NLJ89_g3049 [Agrocybe chaxingu]|uniref:Chromo domain-containing protein n=1 Tax=Agrocybe chaxingu TaxID=84603 RepID=A0A9W8MX68_9AGAR|nr:hypothetical protein NLJ89_g3049 [Agrocybe chaxingu]